MSPAVRVTGLMLIVGASVKAAAFFITPVLLLVLIALFLSALLLTWLLTP